MGKRKWRADLVVDIDAVQVELLDPCGHRVGCGDWVRTSACRDVGRTEDGDDQFDAGRGVLRFDTGTLGGCERGPFLGLVPGSFE